jgi:hypothetical protein
LDSVIACYSGGQQPSNDVMNLGLRGMFGFVATNDTGSAYVVY